ncbi:Sugar transferase involved in LPS biosynthesis (colanic, teichoic acid) [Formosa sp. Hel1_31_208]|uniref:sugar transferase n=1 Tax=Formosa sp. Hel1_31_208 TaxID=1798225 RepID=UPI00087AC9B6|nr:sugar transferase [Formosa sp. Hel1_31_208]SDS69678.1 Sugar transferase involved in LPS biosynthesis (colanic, teichoic acid) [Formosa sp. Hel1_31_208]
MISKQQLLIKRIFDVCFAVVLLPVLVIPIVFLVLMSTIDSGQFGIFSQPRIGQHGTRFNIYKIRTLKAGPHQIGQIYKSATAVGQFLRRTKLNELPQLYNVLKGDMSFVGPRPDVEGFADQLQGDDRIILLLKPGITGPATLKYKNEEVILANQVDPETYNRTIIWADKVEINKKYARNWSFSLDLNIILKTLCS